MGISCASAANLDVNNNGAALDVVGSVVCDGSLVDLDNDDHIEFDGVPIIDFDSIRPLSGSGLGGGGEVPFYATLGSGVGGGGSRNII